MTSCHWQRGLSKTSVLNFAELMMADFEDLEADCEFIRRNFSASYKGYYQTWQLCDFEIDIQYNYSSLSWIVTFSRRHKLVTSNTCNSLRWNRCKDGKSDHDILNLPWKNITDASQPYPFENNIQLSAKNWDLFLSSIFCRRSQFLTLLILDAVNLIVYWNSWHYVFFFVFTLFLQIFC